MTRRTWPFCFVAGARSGRRHQYARPGAQAMVIAFAHAQHFADNLHGQAEGIVLDDVHLPAALRIQQSPAICFDAWRQLLDHARGERLIDEAAQPGMCSAVGIQHVVRKQTVEGWFGRRCANCSAVRVL